MKKVILFVMAVWVCGCRPKVNLETKAPPPPDGSRSIILPLQEVETKVKSYECPDGYKREYLTSEPSGWSGQFVVICIDGETLNRLVRADNYRESVSK